MNDNKTLIYRCEKCGITKYVKDDERFNGICKCCKQPMKIDNNNWWLSGNSNNSKNNNTSIEPTITCPYCHSTNTSKIGTLSRVVSTGLFGLGSKKVGKQWHCNKCGSDF